MNSGLDINGARAIVEGASGEEVESLIQKHSSFIGLTTSHAVKVYPTKDEPLVRREAEWVCRFGKLECRVHRACGSHFYLIMPRLPDSECLGNVLTRNALGDADLRLVVERIGSLQTKAASQFLSARDCAEAVLANLQKQLSSLDTSLTAEVKSGLSNMAGEVVARWIDIENGRPVQIATHSNLFSPNIFIRGSKVVFIDPIVATDHRARSPFFTEAAPLYADLMFHRSTGAGIEPEGLLPSEDNRRGVFLLVALIKTLVRLRFAVTEREFTTPHSWVISQNRLVEDTALLVSTALAHRLETCLR